MSTQTSVVRACAVDIVVLLFFLFPIHADIPVVVAVVLIDSFLNSYNYKIYCYDEDNDNKCYCYYYCFCYCLIHHHHPNYQR